MSALGAGAANGGGDGQRPAIGREPVLLRPQHSECADFVSCDTLKMAEDQRARVAALLQKKEEDLRQACDAVFQRRLESIKAKRAQEEANRIAAVNAEMACVKTETANMLLKCMTLVERGEEPGTQDGFECGSWHRGFRFERKEHEMCAKLSMQEQMAAAKEAAADLGIDLQCGYVYKGGSRYTSGRFGRLVWDGPVYTAGFECITKFEGLAAPVTPVASVAPALDEPW